jgi:hypothetical protein
MPNGRIWTGHLDNATRKQITNPAISTWTAGAAFARRLSLLEAANERQTELISKCCRASAGNHQSLDQTSATGQAPKTGAAVATSDQKGVLANSQFETTSKIRSPQMRASQEDADPPTHDRASLYKQSPVMARFGIRITPAAISANLIRKRVLFASGVHRVVPTPVPTGSPTSVTSSGTANPA